MKKSGSRRRISGLSVYSNLSARRKSRKDIVARQKAEYLASLPKHPLRRLLYRLHPRRFFAYWFSKQGAMTALKLAGIGALILFVFIGALFAYYRRELDAIRPGEISKRVHTTVTTYLDRNGQVLWEDKGDGDYKLVVDSKDISKFMKDATVALEDKDFYSHSGVSPTGIIRAAVNNFSGGSTQGGSTLTQQLVKLVFFKDEAADRGLSGVPRKIKEAILSIEVERMYNKDQILSLYLNEAPYGGRRNGVESAAQTYFGKPAKELSLAESALLASIPQQPGYFNPYNVDGNKSLLTRQKFTLDKMAEQNKITKEEAENAKKVAVLDTVKPESDTYKDGKAPHFVREVKQQLESQLGAATVGRGGLTVKTTLDARMQDVVETAVTELFQSVQPTQAGFDNSAVTIVDVPTGQVLAMMGSRDYAHPGYGYVNASTSHLQPGSSIKPLVFAALFKQQPAGKPNWGAGSALRDEPINQIYGAQLNNFDNKFKGDMSIRQGLAQSRNVPAVKAMHIAGRDATLKTIHEVGDVSYCTVGAEKQVGLAAAIGGCGLKQVEHVNSFATLARGGVYKPVSYFIEVKNSQGQILKQWKDDQAKQVLDPQIPFILSDILSDDAARAPSFGFGARGLNVPGVKTATKTGTSNLENKSRDLWMMSYTPRVAMGIWAGNHDGRALKDALSYRVGPTVDKIMGPVHKDVLQKDGTWKPGDWFKQPAGIQKLTVSGRTDIFPSWYSKPQSTGQNMTFDSVSKKKATDCTPPRAKVELRVDKFVDPVTNKEGFFAPDGYDATKSDDLHKCDDVKPFVTGIDLDAKGSGSYEITATVTKGTHALQTVEFRVDGQTIASVPASDSDDYQTTHTFSTSGNKEIVVVAIDSAMYDASANKNAVVVASGPGSLLPGRGRGNRD